MGLNNGRRNGSIAFEEGKKSFPRYPRCSNEVVDDVQPNFIITRNNQGPRNSRLLQFYVTAPLPCSAVPKLLKNADDLFPV